MNMSNHQEHESKWPLGTTPPLAWAFRRGSLRNWATQRGRSSCGPRRLLRSLEDEVRGEVKWVISHKLGQKLGFPMDSWIDFEDMTVKFERFLQWWVIIGCTLITGCWANLFSVKTHVSNMQGGQVDYHGTMAVPHLGSQSNGFDWILGFLAPPNPMVYRGVSSRFPVKLPFYTPTVTNVTCHISSQDSQLLLSNLCQEVVHIISRFEHNAWDEPCAEGMD